MTHSVALAIVTVMYGTNSCRNETLLHLRPWTSTWHLAPRPTAGSCHDYSERFTTTP